MRVGILVKTIPPWGYGGNPREAIQIAKYLYSEESKATIICFSPDRRDFEELDVVPMKPLPYPRHVGDIMPVPQILVTTVKAVKKLNLDILLGFCAGSAEGLAAALVAKMMSVPCVIRTTGNDIIVDLQKYPSLIKPPLLLCDTIVPINEYMQNLIVRRLPKVKQKTQIVPIAVDVDLFSPKKDGSKVRTIYKIENAFIVLTVARLVKRKGIDYLLMAMKNVLQEDPNVRLIVVGDGPERYNLLTLASQLNIMKNVIFEKHVPENLLPHYYTACDVFVLPSIKDKKGGTEAFGKVLAESLACERPVIGTRVGGIPSIVQDGKTGFLVEECQPESLASAILKLRYNPELRQRMGKYGRSIVIENYASEKVMKQWIDLFKNLLAHK